MKKTLITIICIWIFAAGYCSGAETLANDGVSGLYAKSIEYVLRLEPDEVDLATAALIISRDWDENVNIQRYVTKLNDMAYEIREILIEKKLKPDYKAVEVINDYLFKRQKIESVPRADDPEDLFLHSVLDRKRGYCLSLSILYLSLAERLGIPLYGVVVPGHFFVRYDDGRTHFNIETTNKGGFADDKYYLDKFVTSVDADNSIYMNNLNKLQTLGCLLNNLGNTFSETGGTEKAMLALERAVKINPDLSESRLNLGNIYLALGRIEDAILEYRQALKINPNDAKTHNNLGNAYGKNEWFNYAVSEYEQAIELDPNFVDAYRNLSVTYSKLEMLDKAASTLKMAIELAPDDANTALQLGDVYRQDDKIEPAIKQYQKALSLKTDLAVAHFGLGICYRKIGLPEDEINEYKKALAIDPDMVPAMIYLADAYFEKKEYDQAVEYYSRAAYLKADDSTIFYNLAAAYFNNGLYQQAAATYQKAIEIEPQMGPAHNGLALAYYNLKKYQQAAKHLQIAEKLGFEVSNELKTAIQNRLK